MPQQTDLPTDAPIIREAEEIARGAQAVRPKQKRGYSIIPNRLFVVSKGLRHNKVRALWYVAWRTVGQKGKERAAGIRPQAVARRLNISVRVAKRILIELEEAELIVRKDVDRHGAPKYRLADWIIERNDEGKYADGYTRFPNAAWVWLGFLSGKAWRTLITLVQTLEPKWIAVRKWRTLRRRSLLGERALNEGLSELRDKGVLATRNKGISIETGDAEYIENHCTAGYKTEGTEYDVRGMFSYPDVTKKESDPTKKESGHFPPQTQNPHINHSLIPIPNNFPDAPLSSSLTVATSRRSQNRRAAVSGARSQTETEPQPDPPQYKTSLTSTECRLLVAETPALWRDLGIEQRPDGEDNYKLDPCPWCGGNDCSIHVTGKGQCWNCGRAFFLTELVNAAREADGLLAVEDRKVVRCLREYLADEDGDAWPTPQPISETDRAALDAMIESGDIVPTEYVRFGEFLKWLPLEGHLSMGDTPQALLKRLWYAGWLRLYRVHKGERWVDDPTLVLRWPRRLSENLHRIVFHPGAVRADNHA